MTEQTHKIEADREFFNFLLDLNYQGDIGWTGIEMRAMMDAPTCACCDNGQSEKLVSTADRQCQVCGHYSSETTLPRGILPELGGHLNAGPSDSQTTAPAKAIAATKKSGRREQKAIKASMLLNPRAKVSKGGEVVIIKEEKAIEIIGQKRVIPSPTPEIILLE